jgi:hypothetical protein
MALSDTIGFSQLSSLLGRDSSRAPPVGPVHDGHHYNPNQPRVPAGHPDGGQWTRVAGSQSEATRRWLEIFELAAADRWQAAAAVPHIQRPGYTPLASAFLTPRAFQLASMLRLPGQRPGVVDQLESGGGGRFIGGGSTAGGPSPFRPKAAEQLKKNKAAGAAFENSTRGDLQQQGVTVQGQITVKTQSGLRTRVDLMTHNPITRVIECVECKASQTAPVRPNQAKAFREIEQSGGTIVGAGKPGFVGGTKIPPNPVKIIRGR